MSNKIKFYPFASELDPYGVRFVPYDNTNFELRATKSNFDAKALFNKFKQNTDGYVPTFNPNKTYTDNLQDLHNKLGYWPEPMLHQYVYEDIPIEYDDVFTEETTQPNYKHRWQDDRYKHYYEPPKDDDDDLPF
jgi:hypothetical protein